METLEAVPRTPGKEGQRGALTHPEPQSSPCRLLLDIYQMLLSVNTGEFPRLLSKVWQHTALARAVFLLGEL